MNGTCVRRNVILHRPRMRQETGEGEVCYRKAGKDDGWECMEVEKWICTLEEEDACGKKKSSRNVGVSRKIRIKLGGVAS